MPIRPESEFVFIGRGDESFLENYSYELNEDPSEKGGRVFMSLEILNNQAEAEDIGEALFANFRQKFYELPDADSYDRFEDALKAANDTIEALKEGKVSRFIGNLNVSLGAIVGNTLYISTCGDAEIYLVRKRFISIVSEGLASNDSHDVFANIANGTLEPGDCVLFSSARLLRYLTKGELGKLFGLVGPGQMSKALNELQDFLTTEILGRCAVLGAYLNEEEEIVQEGGDSFEMDEGRSRFGEIVKKWLPDAERFDFLRKIRIPGLAIIGGFMRKLLPSRIGEFLGDIKDNIASRVPNLAGRISGKPALKRRMSTKQLLLFIILLGAMLFLGTVWLRARVNDNRIIAENQARLNAVRQLIAEATTIGQYDKTKAAELLSQAEKEAVAVLNGKVLRGEAVKVMDDLQNFRDTLDEVKRIKAPAVLADFSAKRPTVSALGLTNLGDRIFGFEYNALYEIILDKLSDPLTISDIETVILGTSFAENDSLLFITRIGKMLEYSEGRFNELTTADGIWKKGVDMKSYNERVYLLDPDRNQIWRYQRRRDGFSAAEGVNQDADIKNTVSLAIDSNIYLLNKDGTVTKLYQGKKAEFPLRRSPLNALSEPTRIYTAPELNHIFILEPNRKRVLLYRKDDKNGGAQYQTQYVFDEVGVLRDLVVYDNRLYIMDDKKVYFINLSGL